jgi:hypothetical protein
LRTFASWAEQVPPLQVTAEDEALDAAADGVTAAATEAVEPLEYYFLHDSYVVTASVFVDEQIAFDTVTDDWKRFCHERLEFAVPADADAPAS